LPRTPEERGRLKLPSLRQWRMRRGLSQSELAHVAGMGQTMMSKVETGKLRCDLPTARKLAEALEIDLEKLQAAPETGDPAPMVINLALHRAYLGRILSKEVGSAYSALEQEELKRHCRRLAWKEMLGVVSSRRRELEYLKEELKDTDLAPQVRRFYEEVVKRAPDQDIRLLAVAREREVTERGREELTRAMRELL
jgi:transcriptional regulator with XRE-family HTH domain